MNSHRVLGMSVWSWVERLEVRKQRPWTNMALFISFIQGGREEMVWQPEGVWVKQECWRWETKNIIWKKKKKFLVVSHPLSLADLKICSSSSEARVPNKNGLMPDPSALTCAEWHHQSPLLSYHHQASFKPSFPSPWNNYDRSVWHLYVYLDKNV